MGRPIRIQDPDLFFHITVRTDQAMYLLRPDDELNEIAHGWLLRAVEIFRPELLAAVVMSNHPHLIARLPIADCRLPFADCGSPNGDPDVVPGAVVPPAEHLVTRPLSVAD